MKTEFAIKDDGIVICTFFSIHCFSVGDFIEDRDTSNLYIISDVFYVLGSGKIEKRVIEIEVAE